jgi:hypothetical protein
MHDNLMDIMASMSEIQELQDQIISIQQEALKKVFSLLCQHISVKEVESTEAYRQINKAAALREALGRKEA